MSILLRRQCYWGVCITEVAVLLRWQYYWGVCITQVALLQND